MATDMTRGGLVPAKLINLGTKKEEVKCMFNPFEYTLSKQNSWQQRPAKGKNTPSPNFVQGGSQILKLTLHFDALMDNGDVRTYTDILWRMMMVDEDKEFANSGKGTPPEVAFEWGRLYFKATLTNMSQKFTLFKEDGTPLRAVVDVTLEQKIDIDDYKDSPSLAAAEEKVEEVINKAADRIDNVVSDLIQEGSGLDIRKFLEDNNIDNPLNLIPGQKLKNLFK